ncbi:MAG: type II toxin-antitoxin system Phd/YefM family antitoxin [Deltaproteobacteria bacterium]|nr:type II toxin-antitoxin system Phd/YefM family antitoxin [Deltaproteobacteria bacterium]
MQLNIYEAKAKLSKLIERALQGEEVIIAKGNKPLVRLEPLPEAKGQRALGQGKSYILSVSDDFDAPLKDFKDYES